MSFPTVGQTATVAVTTTGLIGAGSFYMASKSQSTSHAIGFGALGILSAAFNIGFISSYMRSTPATTPTQYLKNGISDTGPVIAAGTTFAVQNIAKACLDGVSQGIKKNVYDVVTGKPKDENKKPTIPE